MKKIEPLVSVILPVYNAGVNLPHCIESLLKQKHQKIEIIAIDDNSKDNSVRVLNKYKKRDNRIKVYRNVKRYGLAVSLNRALKRAHGDFVTFMNPHDINSVWRIKKQLQFLKDNPKVVAVGTQAISIDEKGKSVEKTDLPEQHEAIYASFLQGLSVQFETLMINRKRIPRDLLYFVNNKYPFVYTETFVKLFQYGKIANLLQHLYYHRGMQIASIRLTRKEKFFKQMNILVKSITMHDYRPSLKTVLEPFIGGSKTAFR